MRLDLGVRSPTGDRKRKRKSGDARKLAIRLVDVGMGVFEGVPGAIPAPVAFDGAVCAPMDWNPSQRASSRTLAVLAW